MPRKVYVTVENTSAVPAIFTCKLDHFQSQEQVPLNIEIVQREDTQTQSAKAYEFCKQLLKTKRAFTISVYPSSSSINLLAHDTITIRLIGYAEIFGEFHDTLTISVLPLKKYEAEPRALIARLPVIARAYGSPVNFLMATKSMNKEDFNECLNAVVMDAKLSELLLSSIVACEWTATLGFISSITGKREQEVKLRNNSSFTVRIDWHLYCYESRGDNGLLDLCTAVNDQTHFTEGQTKLTHASEAKLSISLPLRPQGSYAVSRSYATAGRLIEPMGIKESGITLFPLQTIIPPHREASTFVSIDGRIAGSQKETKIEAYAQGFISIEKEEDNVRLLEPLFLPHLRLNLKATVTQPAVILEYGDELGVPVRLPPCPAECTPKSFQIILRAEDFILSTSLFSSIQQKSSGRQEDEDQLLILEYNKSPGVPQHLADRIWCFRRLAVRNLSPYPVAIQAEASEGEFFFKEDVQLKAQHHSHVIEIPNSPQTKEQLHSKKWLKVAANDTQYAELNILLGCLVTRARLSKASTSTVQTRFGKLSCALRCSEQAETVLASTEIQIVIEKRLKLPEIALISPMLVDFPDTAVKQSSTIDVKIANLGVSGTIWVVEPPNAITGKKPKLEGLRVFSTTPTSGFLAATADPFRQDCARLSVKFTPRMAGEYTEELVILDALTKRTVSVHLRGRGYLQRLPN
ncbi:TonB box [Echinococcus multilocularis]|uniref:TonB box n=1 Tax=Echinococcus multilocularis TaxID=6211 RepID=A0A068YDN7_ECHMU|nr:TonB box [Echinococcus multilocularis]